MAAAQDDAIRLAVFIAWNRRCAWCGEPLTYREMEIDHLIPKSLSDAQLADAAALHGLPADFCVEDVRNLIPSCRSCNGSKSARLPPKSPAVTMLLDRAQQHQSTILAQAQTFKADRKVSEALAIVMACDLSELSDEAKAHLAAAIEIISPALSHVTAGAEVVTDLHPAVRMLADPQRWAMVHELSGDVAMVSDGRHGGYVGTHHSYECFYCGSHGPWDGIICRTCGHRSEPD